MPRKSSAASQRGRSVRGAGGGFAEGRDQDNNGGAHKSSSDEIGGVPLAGLVIYSYRLADRLIRHRKNVSTASKSISEEGVIGNISRSASEFSIGR
jgi:hypothetical protein